jgi:tetrahydromethanopterin S-methyltransferase subunit B
MRRGEKSLEVRAKQHISICCKTLCEREIVEEYINQLEERVKELEQMVENLGKESR